MLGAHQHRRRPGSAGRECATPSWRSKPQLAEAAMDRTARRDPAATDHMMQRGRSGMELTPGFDWAAYIAAAGTPRFDQINVAVSGVLQGPHGVIAVPTPLDDLKAYLAWQLVQHIAEMLPKAFADADFDFLQPHARRPGTAAAPLAALRHADRRPSSARRLARRLSRGVRPGGQSRHARRWSQASRRAMNAGY